MYLELPQFVGAIIILLWIDFIVLLIVRKIKLPDFFAHVCTGFLLGLLISNFGDMLSLYLQVVFTQFTGLFEVLIMMGLFFFFLEFAFRTRLKTYRIAPVADYRIVFLYTGTLAILISIATYMLMIPNAGYKQLIFLPVALLAADLGGLVTGGFFDPDQLRLRYLDFMKFTLALETVSILAYLLFAVPSQIELNYLNYGFFILPLIALILFWAMSRPKWTNRRIQQLQKVPVFPLVIGILLMPILIGFYFSLPIIFTGMVCGIALQVLVRQNRILREPIPLGTFRFFIIFPLAALGITISANVNWIHALLDALVILFALLIAAFIVGIFWMRREEEYVAMFFSLLYRGEITLFFLLWGYLQNIIPREIIAAVLMLSLLLHIIARLGLIRRLQTDKAT